MAESRSARARSPPLHRHRRRHRHHPHAFTHPITVNFALPVERRITLEPRRLEAALAHIKIWTPSETLPLFYWQDALPRSTGPAPDAVAQPQPRTFAIPPGSLGEVLETFESLTGGVHHALGGRHSRAAIAGRDRAAHRRAGALGAPHRNRRQLSLHGGRRGDPSTIRVNTDAVQVSGALPRVESTKFPAPPLADTPQTIQVIPHALIDDQGARR